MFLRWSDLVCGYAGHQPLHQPFSGGLSQAGLYAILGPNGSGKSTLMLTWLGLKRPLAGTVWVNHDCCRHVRGDTPCIGYVPQFHHVNPYFHITVRDLVEQGFGRLGRPDAGLVAHADELLASWDLREVATRSFHELSMGQKTRALIARALVSSPRLLFLDEPLASLDAHCQTFLMDSLRDLALKDGVCVVMIDHHLERYDDLVDGKFILERRHYKDVCSISFVESRREPLPPTTKGGCTCQH
jgi:ABC-type Mn2+/Zn2+ transport system ATPase subunit